MAKTQAEKDAEKAAKEAEKKVKAEAAAAEKAAKEAEADAEDGAVAWDVLNVAGEFIRTYSLEVHGEEAGALAEKYADKIGGSVRAQSAE